MDKKKVKNPKGSPVTVKDGDSTRTVGYYKEETKVFSCIRDKEQHFMRKSQSWGLDKKVVDYLVLQDANILITDKHSKWKYSVSAKNLKAFGTLATYGEHGEQYFLNVDKWTILRAKDRSFIVKCEETQCAHNFAKNCILGGVTIDNTGGCKNYECK